MARRRKFGGTAMEHRKQARGLAPNMRSWVKEFNDVLGKTGASYGRKCHEALLLLTGAARVQARYHQERSWGAQSRTGFRGSSSTIRKMERRFYNACVVAPR
jgi:hypothetical protein